jgi:sensor histidine kinase YesM
VQGQTTYSRLIGVMTHILVWAVFGLAIFYYQPVLSDFEIPIRFWIKQTAELSLLVVIFYLNSFVLVPRLLLKNHRAAFLVIIIGIVIATVVTNKFLDKAYAASQQRNWRQDTISTRERGPLQPGESVPRRRPPQFIPGGRGGLGITLTVAITSLVIGISTAITAIQKWQKDNQERKELEKEKVTSELSFLKAQISPHFFFNTLNNIYALTATEPKVAGEAIHQLSKMMRYLLYDTQQGQTMLSQEIAFIKNYIHLMKLRLTDVVKINVDMPGTVNDMPLAPMILLPFVENAFKHGTSATQPCYIHIIILQRANVLDVTIKNSIINDNSISLDRNSGIGLVNTRRRLDLIYPGKYKLDIGNAKTDSEYSIHLFLDLS